MEIKKTKPCPHCCDRDDDGCAQHIYRGHNCPYCKGALRVPDNEPVEDYAVRAAQEWFAKYSKYSLDLQDEEKAIQRLAEIIRKHVTDNMSTLTEQYVLTEMGDRFASRDARLSCGCLVATPDCKAH